MVSSRRVTGVEEARVGEAAVKVYVIEGTLSITVQAGSIFTRQDGTSRDLFAPDHGLFVRSSTKTTTIDPSGRGYDLTEELELTSLQPA